ncbi:MAG: energy-coupling factor transporter transmembrane component T family protein [Nocardioides sp.]
MRNGPSRDLHPLAWWVWAGGLAVAASLTTNPFVLLLFVAAAAFVVLARRGEQPWALGFRLYLMLGILMVAIRVGFRILLGGGYPGTVIWVLPEIPLPEWVLGIRLLGPVTRESLLSGLYDGMRLATIVICFGAANSLANPKRLLKSVPPALYEIGTALVVAVTVLPSLVESARRVRMARELRGPAHGTGSDADRRRFLRPIRGVRQLLVPVLEDALDRSLRLAAGMDARGYGRPAGGPAGRRGRTGALMLAGLGGICVGAYALLDQTAPRFLAMPMLLAGSLSAVLGVWSAGRGVRATRYRPDRWRAPELLTVVAGVCAALLGWLVARYEVALAYPALDAMPEVSPWMLAAALLALAPGVLTPPPSATPRRDVTNARRGVTNARRGVTDARRGVVNARRDVTGTRLGRIGART